MDFRSSSYLGEYCAIVKNPVRNFQMDSEFVYFIINFRKMYTILGSTIEFWIY